MNKKMKVVKKANVNTKRQHNNVLSAHDKKIVKINKKKKQLSKENRKLSLANARMKKTIVRRNDVKVDIDSWDASFLEELDWNVMRTTMKTTGITPHIMLLLVKNSHVQSHAKHLY